MDPAKNPIALEQNAAVEETLARLRALERSYFPRFYLQGAAYTRGSGAETNGKILGGLNGLAPNTQNYALGFTVTFPMSDLPSIRAREAAQTATIRAQQARSAQIATDLRAQWNRAVAMLNGARRIAANTPIQVSAARTATQQATARYESGLGNYRRSRRRTATAHTVRDRRRARPSRRLARIARRGGRRRRYSTLRRRGRPVTHHAPRPGSPNPTDDRSRGADRDRALRRARSRAYARRYLSAGRRPRNLCRPALWRHGPRADGRLPHLLLRVSLPLHHRHRSRGEQEHSRRRAHEIGISRRHQSEPGDVRNRRLREPRPRLHAAGNRAAIHHTFRRRQCGRRSVDLQQRHTEPRAKCRISRSTACVRCSRLCPEFPRRLRSAETSEPSSSRSIRTSSSNTASLPTKPSQPSPGRAS